MDIEYGLVICIWAISTSSRNYILHYIFCTSYCWIGVGSIVDMIWMKRYDHIQYHEKWWYQMAYYEHQSIPISFIIQTVLIVLKCTKVTASSTPNLNKTTKTDIYILFIFCYLHLPLHFYVHTYYSSNVTSVCCFV